MQKKINVAVVGATGLIGETMIRILEEKNFPVDRLYLLASERSKGKSLGFRNEHLKVEDLSSFDFHKVELALFSAGGAVSRQFVPIATKSGCLVIDNTSEFRYNDDVPLVVPEVNAHQIQFWEKKHIIANPNCSTIQMCVALYPLHLQAKIKRINVATYQSVSGAGRSALETLKAEVSGKIYPSSPFPLPIANNAIAHIDRFLENGYTKEEMKMVWETRKIFNEPSLLVNPTAVRIPVSIGHSEVVHIETAIKLGVEEARTILKKSPGITVKDERMSGGYPSPLLDASGKDNVFVGRIREDISHPNGLNMWIVADNVRKGGALNSIQIAQHWFEFCYL
ncbi:MAG TPA: aspartate-semialdehyde dehydrogenase [Gammaproteobacteria bacterium]|nr:aspartate-semialdehyde dehydrogenase [Gammaproteobacteria bacterium]